VKAGYFSTPFNGINSGGNQKIPIVLLAGFRFVFPQAVLSIQVKPLRIEFDGVLNDPQVFVPFPDPSLRTGPFEILDTDPDRDALGTIRALVLVKKMAASPKSVVDQFFINTAAYFINPEHVADPFQILEIGTFAVAGFKNLYFHDALNPSCGEKRPDKRCVPLMLPPDLTQRSGSYSCCF